MGILRLLRSLTTAQRFALADFGRAGIRFKMWKKLEARKMLLEAADSQKSAARCVGRRYALRLADCKKTTPPT